MSAFTAPLRHRMWELRAMAAGCIVGLSGCTTAPVLDPQLPAPVHANQIAQVQEGSRLRFSVCQTCPDRTPKTLGGTASSHAAVAPGAAVPAPAGTKTLEQTSGQAVARGPHALVATVHFDFARSAITERSRAALDALRPLLGMASDIHITGFTDSLGPKDINVELASARARAVLQALAEPAGSSSDLCKAQERPKRPGTPVSGSTTGKALCCYLQPNETEEGRATNRRAEVSFTVPRTGEADRAIARASQFVSLRSQAEPVSAPRPSGNSIAQPR